VARETASAAKQTATKAGQMTVQEAQMILELPPNAGWGEVVKVSAQRDSLDRDKSVQ